MKKRVIAFLMSVGMILGISATAGAEDLEARIAALEARVAALEALLEGEAEEAETDEYGIAALEETYTLVVGIGTVMRETPEEKGKVAVKLRVGNEVTVLGASEEWLKIQYKDEVGYANRLLLEGEA